MAVPSKDSLYRPILEIAAESDVPWSRAQYVKAIGKRLSLTPEDLAERIPSGGHRIFDRVDWAHYDLKTARLMERPIRGRFQINSAGRDYLKEHTGPITNAQLKKLELQLEYAESSSAPMTSASSTIDTAAPGDDDTSPQDRIDAAHRDLQEKLADSLLDSISQISPDAFERLVVDLLEKMGYGKGETVGRSGDGGIDGIINQDALGLEKVYIQAKRWQNQVGEPAMRNFSGSLGCTWSKERSIRNYLTL